MDDDPLTSWKKKKKIHVAEEAETDVTLETDSFSPEEVFGSLALDCHSQEVSR